MGWEDIYGVMERSYGKSSGWSSLLKVIFNIINPSQNLFTSIHIEAIGFIVAGLQPFGLFGLKRFERLRKHEEIDDLPTYIFRLSMPIL